MPRSGYSNTMGIGARIKIRYGSIQQIREVGSNETNNMIWQHFGLGSVNVIDSLIVYWPSGLVERMTNVNANQTLYVDECLVAVQSNSNRLPEKFALYQNIPNPFNPVTIIKYQLPKETHVKLEVFDYLGRLVTILINSQQNAGYYEAKFDGEHYSSGIYFYKISIDNYVETKKMILLK
jgi:hypothetical protein